MEIIKSVSGEKPVIQPCVYSATCSDLYSDSTGRTAETGQLISHLIRSSVYKIQVTFKGKIEEVSSINTLFSGTSLSVVFSFLGEYRTCTMYPSDRKVTQTGEELAEISFSLIEY